MQPWENYLARWHNAGLIDAGLAARIRAFETQGESHAHRPTAARWQVVIALVLGGILLAAGLLLFVASHWDTLSPGSRLALVMVLFGGVHLAGMLSAERFPAMSTTLHAIGTVGAGGAIATVGQIYNMQEHWPAAILLWALCAAAGYWFLRDQFQLTALMLLAPAWVLCEYADRACRFREGDIYCARAVAVLAAIYLTALVRSDWRVVRWVLFGLSSVALLWCTIVVADGFHSWREQPAMLLPLRATGVALVVILIAAAALFRRHTLLPVCAVTVMLYALPWLQHVDHSKSWQPNEPSVLSYLLAGGVAIVFTWWGVSERSRATVNFGILAFALCVLWFYFSSLMDKMDRSLGLIGLGILFLFGGWMLERLRRRLIHGMLEVNA